jgi:hypothetical protein
MFANALNVSVPPKQNIQVASRPVQNFVAPAPPAPAIRAATEVPKNIVQPKPYDEDAEL